MESTPPESNDDANIHDLRRASEEHSTAIDALTSVLEAMQGSVTSALKMLDRIERRDAAAAERHRELCDAVNANTASLAQFGELVHEGNRIVRDHEARISTVEEHLLHRSNGHGGPPAQSPAE